MTDSELSHSGIRGIMIYINNENHFVVLQILNRRLNMKRIVAVLLSTCLIASCNSPEDKAEDFFEDMMEALEEQDFDKVLNVFCEYV